jgi:hypothetical protein
VLRLMNVETFVLFDYWGVVATLIVVAPFIYPPWLTYWGGRIPPRN